MVRHRRPAAKRYVNCRPTHAMCCPEPWPAAGSSWTVLEILTDYVAEEETVYVLSVSFVRLGRIAVLCSETLVWADFL